MAGKRKSYARRPAGRRYRKRVRRTRMKRPLQVYACKRMFWSSNWAWDTLTTGGFWRNFIPTMANLPSVNEFTSLFDEYKLCGVKVTFRPKFTEFSADATNPTTITQASAPYIHICVDPKANIGPVGTYSATTLNSFLENGNIRSYLLTRPVSVYFRPSPPVPTSSVSSAMRGGPRWLVSDAIAQGQPGISAFIAENNLAGNLRNFSVDVFYTFYMKWRGTR